ncbi:ABC-type branched-chain amino acid transport systems periplasmic component-like protein [Parafrankia sp. EUN1f]|nr:ABC-type branched-chain amino acid transport systems periplasmic component-like protein [Parafrankia sp. EUN1f]
MLFRRPRRLNAAVSVIVISSLTSVVATCGIMGGGDGSRPATEGCATPGVTSTQVTLGTAFDDTGIGAGTFAAFRAGIDARLGVANDNGGVNGRKVVYDWEDTRSDPSSTQDAVRELVETKGVFGIIQGSQRSLTAVGSADYAEEHGIPVVGPSMDESWPDHPNMISWFYAQSARSSVSTWGAFALSQGATRAAILGLALNPGAATYQAQLQASMDSAGIPVVLNPDVTVGATSFNRLAQELKAANVDTITGAVSPEVLAQVMPAVRAAGLQLKLVLTPTGYDPALLQQLGPQLAGTTIYIDFAPFELNLPAHQRFISALARYTPETSPPQQQSAVWGWISADLYLRGLRDSGECPTRKGFVNALRAVHDYDAGGLLSSKVDFATNVGQLSTCYQFVQISQDGREFIPLNPSRRCGTVVSRSR